MKKSAIIIILSIVVLLLGIVIFITSDKKISDELFANRESMVSTITTYKQNVTKEECDKLSGNYISQSRSCMIITMSDKPIK